MPKFSIETRVKSTGEQGVASTATFLSLEEAKRNLDRVREEGAPEGTSWDDLEIIEVFFDDKGFTQNVLIAMAINEFLLGKKSAKEVNTIYLDWFRVNAPSSCLTKALKHTTDTLQLVIYCESVNWQM